MEINTKITLVLEWVPEQFPMRVKNIILFLTRYNKPIHGDKQMILTHQLCASLILFMFCWWHHNLLLMTSQSVADDITVCCWWHHSLLLMTSQSVADDITICCWWHHNLLMMTSQSVVDYITMQLQKLTIGPWKHEKRYLTRQIFILFTAIFMTGHVTTCSIYYHFQYCGICNIVDHIKMRLNSILINILHKSMRQIKLNKIKTNLQNLHDSFTTSSVVKYWLTCTRLHDPLGPLILTWINFNASMDK